MTTFFVANEVEEWPTIVGATYIGTAPGTQVRSHVRAGVSPNPGTEDTSYLESSSFSTNNFWTKLVFCQTSNMANTYNNNIIKWYAGGTQRLAFYWSNPTTGAYAIRRWNGSSWDTLASATDTRLILASSTLYMMDFHIKLGNPGEFRVYFNNQLVMSQTALDLSFGGAVSNIDKIRLNTLAFASFQCYFSEVIVADYPTLFAKVISKPPTGNGTYQEWINGGFGIVDEITSTYTDIAVSGTADQRTSYTHAAAFTALATSESVAAVQLAANVTKDASGPQNANLFWRIGTTDYHGADQSLATAGTTTRLTRMWETSPATSTTWTITEINGATVGLRSRT